VLRDVPVGSVRPNPHQPRRHFDEDSLSSLAASVRELGVLQPVLVRQVDDGFELIAGERRWRAAKRAGLATIPCIVRGVDDLASLEAAVVENLHRQDLNPLEEAAAYQQLIEDFHLTHDQVATRVGKSRVAVSNTLRLFQLPPSIQKLVSEGRLSAGHARALLGTPDRAFQEQLAGRAVKEGLSVRAVEEAVRTRSELAGAAPSAAAPATGAERAPKLRQAGMHELEELLSEHLATRVRVEEGGARGRVVIEFADLDDLERIYRAMTEPDPAFAARSNPQLEGAPDRGEGAPSTGG
jgi:ParB family chromosome partitioning protein